jgi:hypothetical protein
LATFGNHWFSQQKHHHDPIISPTSGGQHFFAFQVEA